MRAPSKRLRPAATLELFICRDRRVHMEVDGQVVPPLSLIEGSSCALDATLQDVREKVDNLARLCRTLTPNSRVRQYDLATKSVGRQLGQCLFGAKGKENAIHHTLARLYERARTSRVVISLCIEDIDIENLPWEMAVWQRGARDITLGTDPRLALVRRMMTGGYETDEPAEVSIPPLNVLHVTSTAGSNKSLFSEHGEIKTLLGGLARDYEVSARAITSDESWHSDEPIHIFHYYGHSSQDALLSHSEHVNGSGSGVVQIAPERVVPRLSRDQRAPLLCILLGCKTFDPCGVAERGQAWQFLQLGAEATVGMLGRPHTGFGKYFLQTLYSVLPSQGLAAAMQEVRRLQRYLGAQTMLGASPDDDWFRPALMVRNLEILDVFAPRVQTATRGVPGPSAEPGPARGDAPLERMQSALSPVAKSGGAGVISRQLQQDLENAEKASDKLARPMAAKGLRGELARRADDVVETTRSGALEGYRPGVELAFQQGVSAAHYHIRWSAALQALSNGASVDTIIGDDGVPAAS